MMEPEFFWSHERQSTGMPGTTAAILLYDDSCGFCARRVRFVLAHERADRSWEWHFAPLDLALGRDLPTRLPQLRNANSVVWYEPSRDRVLLRSEAALCALAYLGGAWRAPAALGHLVPRPVRDAAYDLVTRNRHRLGGDACLVPSAAMRSGFLA